MVRSETQPFDHDAQPSRGDVDSRREGITDDFTIAHMILIVIALGFCYVVGAAIQTGLTYLGIDLF